MTTLKDFLEAEKNDWLKKFYGDIAPGNPFGDEVDYLDWLSAHDQRLLAKVREMVQGLDVKGTIDSDEYQKRFQGYYDALFDVLSLLTKDI